MPRPNRAHGRPGTRMIPAGFEQDHARVMAGSRTAMVRFTAPTTAPAISDDLTYPDATASTPDYDGPCRVQEVSREERTRLLGDEYQATQVYLVAIDHTADTVARGHVGTVYEADDPTLRDGGQLVVARVTRGSVRFERHVYCIDVAGGGR